MWVCVCVGGLLFNDLVNINFKHVKVPNVILNSEISTGLL